MLMTRRERDEAREVWLEARRQGIGSSDAAVIVGGKLTRKSLLELYAEKIGLKPIDEEEREYLEWGHRLEPVIAAKYEDDTGRMTHDPGDFHIEKHSSADWMRATPDRLVIGMRPQIVDNKLVYTTNSQGAIVPDTRGLPHGVPGVLELKTANAWRLDEWIDEPPAAYQVQVQHQLAVTGHLWGSIAVLIGGQTFLWKDIPRNEAFIARLMTAEEQFWQRVVRRDPPEPDASESASDALAMLYPGEQIDHVLLPVELSDWDDQRMQAIEAMDAAKRARTEAENKIKAALGTAAVGILPTGARYTWKTTNRKGYAVEPTSFRVLRRSEAA